MIFKLVNFDEIVKTVKNFFLNDLKYFKIILEYAC